MVGLRSIAFIAMMILLPQGLKDGIAEDIISLNAQPQKLLLIHLLLNHQQTLHLSVIPLLIVIVVCLLPQNALQMILKLIALGTLALLLPQLHLILAHPLGQVLQVTTIVEKLLLLLDRILFKVWA